MDCTSGAKPSQAKPKSPKSSRASKLSREQLLFALKKKKECNARAQKIIEELLDPVPADKIPAFIAHLAHINQSHYDDIVVERSIMKLCGYPMCDMNLEDVPAKQYHISTKHNKVYDITERKNFCSSQCFKCSQYLREQLLTTPLWVRKDTDKLPEFKLLTLDGTDKLPDLKLLTIDGDALK